MSTPRTDSPRREGWSRFLEPIVLVIAVAAIASGAFAYQRTPIMKRSLFSLLAAVIIALSMTGDVSAGTISLGTPGKANCVGQTMSFLTHPAPVHPVGKPGIGNLRKWTAENFPGHSTDVRAIAVGWCNGTLR